MRIGFFKATRQSREVGFRPNRALCPSEQARRHWRKADTATVKSTVLAVDLALGSDNALFIRGRGAGLTWDHGQKLACVGKGTWAWSAPVADEPIEFQLLLDDAVWERGDTRILEPGRTVQITPDFDWPEIPRVS